MKKRKWKWMPEEKRNIYDIYAHCCRLKSPHPDLSLLKQNFSGKNSSII